MDDLWITDILRQNLNRAREVTDTIRVDLDRAENIQDLATQECHLREDVYQDLKQQLRRTSRISFHYHRLEQDYERSLDSFIAARKARSDAQRDAQELFRDLGGASRTERAAEDEYLDQLDQLGRRQEHGADRLAREAEQLEVDELWREQREAYSRRKKDEERRRERSPEREFFTSQRQAEDEEDAKRERVRTRQGEEGAKRLAEEARRLQEEQERQRQAERDAQDQRRRRHRSESFRGRVPNFTPQRPKSAQPTPTTPSTTTPAAFFPAASKAFASYATLTTFPQPPATPCHHTSCQLSAATRALQACSHNIRSTFSGLSVVELKKWRTKFHPDRFCAVADARVREECKKGAVEVFVVMSEMIAEARW